MKKAFIGIFLAIIFLIVMALAGQFGREFAKKIIASEEEIAINKIANQYADASKKMNASQTEFAKADQKIKSSAEQLKHLKNLLIDCKSAFEHHEEIRQKGYDYLMLNKNVFEKEFYEDMLFSFGEEAIKQCNQAFIEFSLNYMETIDYSILNFDKIVSSKEPELTIYNNKLQSSEKLRQKYNDAYIKKMNVAKNKYGEEEIIRLKEKLNE